MSATPTPPIAPGPLLRDPNDEQHLKLLSIFYYVFAGLSVIGACFGTLYLMLGGAMLASLPPGGTGPDDAPEELGWVIGGLGIFLLAISLVFGVLYFYVGQNLRLQRARTYCLVMAGLSCLSVPLGTILGIFTFVVLSRPSVTAMFDENRA